MHRLRNLYSDLSYRCYPSELENKEGDDTIPGRLPNLSSMSDVLPGRRDQHITGKIHPGNYVMGMITAEQKG